MVPASRLSRFRSPSTFVHLVSRPSMSKRRSRLVEAGRLRWIAAIGIADSLLSLVFRGEMSGSGNEAPVFSRRGRQRGDERRRQSIPLNYRTKGFLIITACILMLRWRVEAIQISADHLRFPEGQSLWKQTALYAEDSTDADGRVRDVRFISPLLEYGYRPAVEEYENKTLVHKPLLLYLPGFDGSFLSPFLQFPELHSIFDIRCMTISSNDRSTFQELKTDVIDFIRESTEAGRRQNDVSAETSVDARQSDRGGFRSFFGGRKQPSHQTAPDRPIYLAGESFGGILASEVALSLMDTNMANLKGLTLINPATCYDRCRLAADGPGIAELHPVLYPVGLLKLLPLFTDEHSFDQLLLILKAKALPSVIDNPTREAYMGRVAFSLPFVLPSMPQETLRWRLTEWLDTGCARMASKLSEFERHASFRTLIIAGEKDRTLPSIDEAERLANILPNTMVHVVEGAGHASTCGSRVDLAALFRRRFRELQTRSGRWLSIVSSRTAMKEVASKGTGPYYGMEPRYDNATIGLSPLKYWSKKYYSKYRPIVESETVTNEQSSKQTAIEAR